MLKEWILFYSETREQFFAKYLSRYFDITTIFMPIDY